MAVNPIDRASRYTISQSSETKDNEQQREKKERTTTSKKRRNAISVKKEFTQQTATEHVPQSESDLSSQLVDSEKVIELLSHRHETNNSKNYLPFKTVNKLKTENTSVTQHKKLNKTL